MRISKINSTDYRSINTKNNIMITKTPELKTDCVSFKGISSSILLVVAKDGYKALTHDISKIKYKKALLKDFDKCDTSNEASQIVTVLFALAKSPAKEEPLNNFIYGNWNYASGNASLTIGYLRNRAMEKLFPLVPEFPDDSNSGHAAKVALMSSLIDTSEYLNSPAFLEAFKSLPSMYEGDKVFLLKKLLRDKNVHATTNEKVIDDLSSKFDADLESAYSNERSSADVLALLGPFRSLVVNKMKNDYIKENLNRYASEINIQRQIANVALLSCLDVQKHLDFFTDYSDSIQKQAAAAFGVVKSKLLSHKGEEVQNRFYNWYSQGFSTMHDTPPYREYSEVTMCSYERHLAKQYLLEFLQYLYPDKEAVMKEFNIDETHCNDLFRDYELYLQQDSGAMANRIKEKENSQYSDIRDSVNGLKMLLAK